MDVGTTLCLCLGLTLFTHTFSFCHFEKTDILSHPAILRLDKLNGTRFSVTGNSGDTFTVGICISASPTPTNVSLKTAGVLQRTAEGRTIIIGSTEQTKVVAGTDWIFLQYGGGEKYHSWCGKTPRSAMIMITCSPGETQGKARIIEENRKKTEDCYYLFEIDHDAACPANLENESHGLSVGSVICIVVLVVASLYLLAGATYQRFIVGAKGMEQIPNYAFWQDFGNLQADGCDFLCRGRGRSQRSREYRGIGDDQLQVDQDEDGGCDDSLLPM